MSAKPTLRVHTSCEPAITPTVILPMLSLANSTETSESTAAIPLTARAGNVWHIALSTRNAPQATDINSALAAASRNALHVPDLLVIRLLIGVCSYERRDQALECLGCVAEALHYPNGWCAV